MSETLVLDPRADELEKVEGWRLHVLLEAGYPNHLAEALAQRPSHEVDLHGAVELVQAGCDHELAARILT